MFTRSIELLSFASKNDKLLPHRMFAYAFVSLSGQIKDKSMDRLSHQTDKETKRHTDRQRDKRECEHLNLGEAIPMHGANLKLTK